MGGRNLFCSLAITWLSEDNGVIEVIYLINSTNMESNESVLDRMFRMRHKVAVDHWGWQIPNAGSGIDKDDFDTYRTTHFLKIDEDGRVHGCARLNPTTAPHLLSEIFPYVCDAQGVPQDPNTFEFSRFFVDKTAMSRRDYIHTGYELLAGIAEWSLHKGIKQLSWYAFQATYGLAVPLWTTAPLGAPQTHDGDESVYVPAISTIDEEAVIRTRKKARVDGPAYHLMFDIDRYISSEAA